MLRSKHRGKPGIAILVSAAVTFAQTAPVTTIQVTTRIVYVDVVARDSYGRIVRGLTEKDFRVLEDGKAQKVDYFHDHTHDAAPVAAVPTGHDGSLDFSNVDAGGDAATSVNIILFDFFNTAPQDYLYARQQMIRFLEKLPPGRQTALFVLGTHLEMLQGFTGSTDRLLAAAKTMKMATSSVETIGEQQQDSDIVAAFAAAGGRSAGGGSAMKGMYQSAAAGDGQQAYDITIAALKQLQAAVSGYPGRKNLYWLADTFSIADTSVPDFNDLSHVMAVDINNLPGIEDTTARVADAQIAIYPISLMGLDASGMGPESRGMTSTKQLFTSRHFMQEKLNNLADATGGQAYFGTNDFAGALQRGFEDGSNYYTLAYRPENQNWNGNFRKIAVKLNEHGYSLAYRRGYYATPEQHAPSDNAQELNAALQPDTPESTMLLLKAKVQLPDAQHATVRVDSVIDPLNVEFSTDAHGRRHARLLVSLIAIPANEDRNVTDKRKQPTDLTQTGGTYVVDLDPQAFQKLLASGMPMHQELALPPGSYRLRLGVSDVGNHRIGTLDMPIQVAAAVARTQ